MRAALRASCRDWKKTTRGNSSDNGKRQAADERVGDGLVAERKQRVTADMACPKPAHIAWGMPCKRQLACNANCRHDKQVV
eukprot:2938204-Pleurochrysis_carterae.AAC.1